MKITSDILDKVIYKVENSALFNDCVFKGTWISGSTCEVFPIMSWEHTPGKCYEIELQMSTRDLRKINPRMKKLRKELDREFPNLVSDNYFNRYDGSCPDVVVFMLGKLN